MGQVRWKDLFWLFRDQDRQGIPDPVHNACRERDVHLESQGGTVELQEQVASGENNPNHNQCNSRWSWRTTTTRRTWSSRRRRWSRSATTPGRSGSSEALGTVENFFKSESRSNRPRNVYIFLVQHVSPVEVFRKIAAECCCCSRLKRPLDSRSPSGPKTPTPRTKNVRTQPRHENNRQSYCISHTHSNATARVTQVMRAMEQTVQTSTNAEYHH